MAQDRERAFVCCCCCHRHWQRQRHFRVYVVSSGLNKILSWQFYLISAFNLFCKSCSKLRSSYGFIILRFGKNGTLVSLSASGKAQKGNKFFVVLLMYSLQIVEHFFNEGQLDFKPSSLFSNGMSNFYFIHFPNNERYIIVSCSNSSRIKTNIEPCRRDFISDDCQDTILGYQGYRPLEHFLLTSRETASTQCFGYNPQGHSQALGPLQRNCQGQGGLPELLRCGRQELAIKTFSVLWRTAVRFYSWVRHACMWVRPVDIAYRVNVYIIVRLLLTSTIDGSIATRSALNIPWACGWRAHDSFHASNCASGDTCTYLSCA